MRDDTRSGTQVVARVSAVLRAVSARAPHPVPTRDVADDTGLTRPTAYRLLSALADEGFLDRDGAAWVLGPELFLLGAVAADRYDITDLALEHVRELARLTGESAFFSARRGDETVCLLREEGSFPIRSFVLHEGIRFPLGVASAGLAMLAFVPDDERAAYLDAVDLSAQWGPQHAREPLEARLAQTRSTGWALNPGLIVEGSWGMGAAVFDERGAPAWALSLTGIESRFKPERQRELGRALLQHAHALSQQVHSRS
ncbi:MAG: IclR family transcriptional regulator [Microcella sp.]|uniref:IclR family transcriptional regulator n=1 Tax=Microcella sp. TaxID=1913979 RepID=UPI0024C7A6AD|nr:IclR family transcriptional regulator [Microcella sp.]UYN83646.1 MAG: IclR family transcriptional regulator [Microcella sp.]